MQTVVDQFSTLNRCLVVFEFFGLQFFSLKKTLRENSKDRIHIFRKIYFGALLSLYIFLGIGSIVSVSVANKVTTKNVLTLGYSHMTTYIFSIAIWISLIQAFVSTRQIKKVFMNSKEIAENCFEIFKISMPFDDLVKTVWKRYASEAFVFVIVHAAAATFKYAKGNFVFWEFLVIIFYTSYFIIIGNNFLFYVCLINFELQFIQKQILFAANGQLEGLNKKLSFSSNSDLPSKSASISSFQAIWKTYNKILENASLANKSLGNTILIILLNLITMATYCGYKLCARAMGDSSEKLIGQSFFY